MDWAGTAIDFGSFAPLNVFLKIFEEKGISITYKQAREPMGMLKIDHIRAIFCMPEVEGQFRSIYGREWNDDDVQSMYGVFEKYLFRTLAEYTDPLPGVVETMAALRNKGIKIGSTTGYTAGMMSIVRPRAAKKGYVVDHVATPSELPAGRPAPYMIHENMRVLGAPSVRQVVKIGDTIADIREGVNAGVWSIGVITGSNELGLNEHQYRDMDARYLDELKGDVQARMFNAGAHMVLDSIRDLPACIETLNRKIEQ